MKDGETCPSLHFSSLIARVLCEIIALETRRPLDSRSCTHSKRSSSRPTSNDFLPPPPRRFLLLSAAWSFASALCHSRILLRSTLNFFAGLEVLLLSSAKSIACLYIWSRTNLLFCRSSVSMLSEQREDKNVTCVIYIFWNITGMKYLICQFAHHMNCTWRC